MLSLFSTETYTCRGTIYNVQLKMASFLPQAKYKPNTDRHTVIESFGMIRSDACGRSD